MIFRVLIEDTNGTVPVVCEHGLSVYVETKKHRYLMDTGASEKTFQNADVLGISVTDVDAVVLSHGHYDHTGGMMPLVERGYRGPVFLRSNANLPYYNLKEYEKYIGIDQQIMSLPGLQLTGESGITKVNEELSLFSGVNGTRMLPPGNVTLYEKKDGTFVPDVFSHEQYAVLWEDGKSILVSGCAHKGILNILARYKELYGTYPDAVISGFHMMKAEGYDERDVIGIRAVSEELLGTGIQFFTGHCTSVPAYEIMKPVMGEKLVYFHAGDQFEIG